jgi:hypothetical protein
LADWTGVSEENGGIKQPLYTAHLLWADPERRWGVAISDRERRW